MEFLEARYERKMRFAARRQREKLINRSVLFSMEVLILACFLVSVLTYVNMPLNAVNRKVEKVSPVPFVYTVETKTRPISVVEVEFEIPSVMDIFEELPPIEQPIEYIYTITEEEKLLFMQIMAAESYSFWTYDDILSLATVVINRYNSSDFPSTFEGILTQKNQFTTYSNGRYLEVEITDECRAAVEAALKGEVNIDSNIMWFCTEDYYNNICKNGDFFKSLTHVYTCRNVYFFQK